MTDHVALYQQRLMSARQAAALIPSGAKIAMGLGVAQPPALLRALADRAAADDIADIRLYYLLATAAAGETVLRPELRHRIRPMSLFHSTYERGLDRQAALSGSSVVDVIPTAFSQTPRMLTREVGVDTLLTTVAPMDENGLFSLGTNTDYALAVSRTAQRVILEVNPAMPRVAGDCSIPLCAVTALVENAVPLTEIPAHPRRPEDEAIGAIIAGLAEDGDCLQMGIGAVQDVVCAALHGHRHLGIHTELMTPGLAGLMRAGVVDKQPQDDASRPRRLHLRHGRQRTLPLPRSQSGRGGAAGGLRQRPRHHRRQCTDAFGQRDAADRPAGRLQLGMPRLAAV